MSANRGFEILVDKRELFSIYQLALNFHQLKQKLQSGRFLNPGSYLAVIGDESSNIQHNKFMARDTRPTIDNALINHWINVCENTHQQCRDVHFRQPDDSNGSRRSKMLIVDVQQLCVNVTPSDCRYATLSYVNGQAGLDNTNLYAQISARALPYSLSRFWKCLPQTIKDAIVLVRQMKESFIWIDALCISQKGPEERSSQISDMAMIYQAVFVNIISADGEDAASGIAGVSSNPREVTNRHKREIKPGFQLRIASYGIVDHEYDITNKIYNGRGWTYVSHALIFDIARSETDEYQISREAVGTAKSDIHKQHSSLRMPAG